MPELLFPRSDVDRLTLLERIHRTGSDQLATGDSLLEETLIDRIGAFLAVYKPKVTAVQSTLSSRTREAEQNRGALERLDRCVHDFFVTLKHRMRRNGEPADLWCLYGLTTDEALPNPKTSDELLQWGDRIVAGEARSVDRGYPAMQNPSVAEVQAALEGARAEMAAVPLADLAHDWAQESVATERNRADSLIHQVNELLESKLYGQEPASIRRVKRNFGFRFRYQEGEPGDPDDVPGKEDGGGGIID